MRTVLVLMDTLRRDALGCYNPGGSARTPNLDAFSSEAVTFDNHWIGSAPCMPARRDIMCGRYNFLERPWGPIEPFDVTLVDCLRAGGVRTHITATTRAPAVRATCSSSTPSSSSAARRATRG